MMGRSGSTRQRQLATGAGRPTLASLPDGIRNPLQIFGAARLGFWLPAETWTPSSWPDKAGNVTLAQATGALQFQPAHGIGGRPTVLSSEGDHMVGTLASPLLAGSRPLVMIVHRWAAVPSETGLASAFLLGEGDGFTGSCCYYYHSTIAGSHFRMAMHANASTPHTNIWQAPEGFDLLPHFVEMHWVTGSAARAFRDGLACELYSTNGSVDTAPLGDLDTLSLSPDGLQGPLHYADLVCVRDATAVTAAELIALRTWAAYRLAS